MPKSVQRYLLRNEQETLDYGAKLARQISHPSTIVYLQGDLGAGKTTLVRGLLMGMGFKGPVKSPTYTLVESYHLEYEGLMRVVHHFDLYRLEDPEELDFIGGREYFDASLCLIEWPVKGLGWLPKADLIVSLSVEKEARQISLEWQNTPA